MTKFKASSFGESFRFALRGLKLAVFSQRNFIIELIVGFFVFSLSVYFDFSSTDKSILLITILIVLLAELLNSVVEFTLDSIYKNSYSKLVEMAKDMAAGIVLLAATFSIIIGGVLFYPYITSKYSLI